MKGTQLPSHWIKADWPASDKVVAFTTTRQDLLVDHGAASTQTLSGYQAFNLASHVNDNPHTVSLNRKLLSETCNLNPDAFSWLEQVHSNIVVQAENTTPETRADASFTKQEQRACVVMTADCLPVLFCNKQATQVAAAHAGWRGLASGILEDTIASFDTSDEILAWLGPAISQSAFEVGDEVLEAFCSRQAKAEAAFCKGSKPGKWYADLYELARIELRELGISTITGGKHCTFEESERFYSYRRDGQVSGRMASVIYLR